MDLIDKVYTDYPFYGSRKIKRELEINYSVAVGRHRVQRLMRLMGIEAIYPKSKRNFSQANKLNEKYPYLLKGLKIIYPNQVWATDITYVRLEKGWVYLVAIIDWFSRYVVSWELSDSLEIDFCLKAIKRALKKNIPEIFNSDQGSQFTSPEFINVLLNEKIRISMDGRGRCFDNIFTERLWRTVKYENIYINSYIDLSEVQNGLNQYFDFYNNKRFHQSLNYKTPREIYFNY